MLIAERPFIDGRLIGGRQPFFLIAGPCVIESRALLCRVCESMKELSEKLGLLYIFKSSFDKANRSSADSRRGPGLEEGLRELEYIKKSFDVALLSDVHESSQIEAVAQVVDILQIPAFLCRQTDMIQAAARTGRWINVKKGQFMAPHDCKQIVEKAAAVGSDSCLITERGASFGYNNLVFDPRSLEILHSQNIPVIMDGSHSTQLPGGRESGGDRTFIPPLTRAAVAVGIEGLFLEVHPDPPQAWSDAGSQYWLEQAAELIESLYRLDRFVKTECL